MANATHRSPVTKKPAATNARNFRTFLLMQQFAGAEIGERIARARKEADGMTQEQLAELLNVSTRSVQDYEAGVTMPWKHFAALTTIFKRPLGWFLHGDQEEVEPNGELVARLDRLEQLALQAIALLDPDGREHHAKADPS